METQPLAPLTLKPVGRLEMSEPDLEDARALRRFRAALAAVDAAPSDAAIAKLRETALPLIHHLRAAYAAVGRPYGDDRAGLYRWVGEVIARRDRETDGAPHRFEDGASAD